MAWRRVSASLTDKYIGYDGVEAICGHFMSSRVVYVVWYERYRNVTLCYGVWRDLGFENVMPGLISYYGNQGRGIFHASYLSPVPVSFSRWMNSLYDYCDIFVVVSVAPVRAKVKVTSLMVSKALMAAALRKPHVSVSVNELTRLAMLVWHRFPLAIMGGRFQIRLLNFLFAWPLS